MFAGKTILSDLNILKLKPHSSVLCLDVFHSFFWTYHQVHRKNPHLKARYPRLYLMEHVWKAPVTTRKVLTILDDKLPRLIAEDRTTNMADEGVRAAANRRHKLRMDPFLPTKWPKTAVSANIFSGVWVLDSSARPFLLLSAKFFRTSIGQFSFSTSSGCQLWPCEN